MKTAVAAGVLALLGGLWHLFGLVAAATSLVTTEAGWFQVVVGVGFNLAVAALLLPGSVKLLRRRPYGRLMVIAGVCAALLSYLLVILGGLTGLTDSAAGAGFAMAGAVLIITIVPAIVTLGLVMVPATERWVHEDADSPDSVRPASYADRPMEPPAR
ncbi:hypothetical protein [Amycolatopsis albispora]|uniref:Uncharacterized protein n=1 Tax=Amycolatopsis albispora TaxID=1804986 RepID=A0A344LAR3_9PSEU|nr:hypothetical protein [Amycolatopsis albispora]AXB45137.1 hypothetical protein A4R43_23725 [Amycolatopsis albispora]